MKKIYIIYKNYLNEDKKSVSIGGIQTYITDLCDVIKDFGIIPTIIQQSNESFEVFLDGITIIGVNAKEDEFVKKSLSIAEEDNVVIFGSHELIRKYKGYSIAIQHGITWDVPHKSSNNKLINYLMILNRSMQSYKLYRKISLINELVCVDYNFLNWYRTQLAFVDTKISVIPNYSTIPLEANKKFNDDRVNIIFARRLYWYRGTRIFVSAIEKVLSHFSNINITIAGEGPDEEYMKERLKRYDNIEFVKYKSEDTMKIHSDKDIAVIPTIGSEGTSLSLLEAMASRCAVIVSNVGGMTNIVIDNYNGIVINPTQEDLENALIKLIKDPACREKLATNAYHSVKEGFSKAIWENKWHSIIERIIIEK